MSRVLGCVVWLTVVGFLSRAYSQVVLSEIMYDAAGSDFHDEFVEMVNLSDSITVDLTGWRISDGSGEDGLVDASEGLLLGPQQFAVILDASYFGNSTTYDARIPPTALIVTIDNNALGSGGLSNSRPETISLIRPDGEVVSQYRYTLGNPPGFSDEKIELSRPNTPENWADSRVLHGTPGARNSVSPLDADLAIPENGLRFSPAIVRSGAPVQITAVVQNVGRLPAETFHLTFFEDADGDTVPDVGEALADPLSAPGILEPGEADSLGLLWEAVPAGPHRVLAQVDFPADQNLANNTAVRELRVGYEPRAMVVNEIMYAPVSGDAEWVELHNRSLQTIDLAEWALSDADTTARAPVTESLLLSPGGYAVLAEDAAVLDRYPIPADALVALPGWSVLNNDFDSVVLFDLTGRVVDRVDYETRWGGADGRSLERINPDLASNDSSNWSTSVAPAGATPGAENSIFTRVVPSEVTLEVEPNPFSPDGDGRDDFAVISYKLPVTTAFVNVKIYDMHGRLIRFLANQQPSGAHGSFLWDGRDDENRPARVGLYIVFLQALNARAGVLKTAKKTVVLATEL